MCIVACPWTSSLVLSSLPSYHTVALNKQPDEQAARTGAQYLPLRTCLNNCCALPCWVQISCAAIPCKVETFALNLYGSCTSSFCAYTARGPQEVISLCNDTQSAFVRKSFKKEFF
jgi:hypothetical protein